MTRVLIVIDMQKDFIDGSLGTPEAVRITAPVRELAAGWEGPVIFTRDTHEDGYLDTQEGRRLPVPHCIRASRGWELDAGLQELTQKRGFRIIDKDTFGSKELAGLLTEMHQAEPIDEITLAGLCTDICVISNALLIKAFLPEIPIRVLSSYCASVTPESHRRALEAMQMCQIEIV